MIDPDYIPQAGDLLETETHWLRVHHVSVGDEVYYAVGKDTQDGSLYRMPYDAFIREARAKAERLERRHHAEAV